MKPISAAVKEELAAAAVGRLCCRRAEVATMLRVAGAVTVETGRVVVAAQLDTAAAAQRLRRHVGDVFAQHAQISVLAPSVGKRLGHQWVVRVAGGGQSLARRVGLVDEHGRLIRGLPPQVVTGATCEAEAVWRAAVLAAGSLSEPGRTPALTVTCPSGQEPALPLALAGAARRLRAPARIRQHRGLDQILITDREAITALLIRIGAPATARAWHAADARAQAHAANGPGSTALPKLTQANLTRSAAAARTAAAELARALEILGGDAPPHLAAAARLRIAHPGDTLHQLGARCDPPLSKDTIAGRIRRLLALADTRAGALGVPTASSATAEPR